MCVWQSTCGCMYNVCIAGYMVSLVLDWSKSSRWRFIGSCLLILCLQTSRWAAAQTTYILPSEILPLCCSKDNIPMRHPYYKGEIQLADTVPSDRSSFHCRCILLPSQSSHRHHFPHSLLFIHFSSFNLIFPGILSTFCCRLFFGKEKDACDDK